MQVDKPEWVDPEAPYLGVLCTECDRFQALFPEAMPMAMTGLEPWANAVATAEGARHLRDGVGAVLKIIDPACLTDFGVNRVEALHDAFVQNHERPLVTIPPEQRSLWFMECFPG